MSDDTEKVDNSDLIDDNVSGESQSGVESTSGENDVGNHDTTVPSSTAGLTTAVPEIDSLPQTPTSEKPESEVGPTTKAITTTNGASPTQSSSNEQTFQDGPTTLHPLTVNQHL